LILQQLAIGRIPKKIQIILDSNKKLFGDKNYHLEHWTGEKYDNMTNFERQTLSDVWRFEQASKDPCFFFSCWDIEWIKMPLFSAPEYPYLIAWLGHKNQGESAILYCNNSCDFFKEKLAIMKEIYNLCYGAQKKVLRDIQFNPVDSELFHHKKGDIAC